MSEYYVKDPVTDLRRPWLEKVPQLHMFEDIIQHFASISVDQTHGWDATPPGEACWKVDGFYVSVGIVEIRPFVLDQDSNYIPNKKVNWYYPGIPQKETFDPPYFDKGEAGNTKASPDLDGAHFMVSRDHYVGPPNPGPDTVWVAAEEGWPRFSDAVKGLGMRSETDHLIVNPIFKYAVKPAAGETEAKPVAIKEPDKNPTVKIEKPKTGDATQGKYLSIVVEGQEIGRISFDQ